MRSRRPHGVISLPLLNGGKARLSSLKGKVVFLNLWATWCGPCRSEMPSMQRMCEKLKGEGLEIVAVDIQENRPQVQAFVTQLGLRFPIALDSDGTVAAQYNAAAIPTTYLFDRNGAIFARAVGARDWSTSEMLGLLQQVLREGVRY